MLGFVSLHPTYVDGFRFPTLEKQVMRIRKQGKSHPFWRWVIDQ